tara:strand:+ start:78 stop:434 length:357 start_codon:yes stop_codon:yes gene_type:complete
MSATRQFEATDDGIDGCTNINNPNHDWQVDDTADDWVLMGCQECEAQKWFEPKEWYGTKEEVCKCCLSFDSDCTCEYCEGCGRNMSYMAEIFTKHPMEMECIGCGKCTERCCDGKCEE